MLKREWGAESNVKLPHLFVPSETAILVPEFTMETCLCTEMQIWFLHLQWKTCPWAEHSDHDDDDYLTNWLLRNPQVHYRPCVSPHWSRSTARAIQFLGSQPTSLKFILILSSHLCLGLSKGFFLSGFPTKTLYAFLDCSLRATCPAHLSRLDLRFLFVLGEEYNACFYDRQGEANLILL